MMNLLMFFGVLLPGPRPGVKKRVMDVDVYT
jgi:hypothetical protein